MQTLFDVGDKEEEISWHGKSQVWHSVQGGLKLSVRGGGGAIEKQNLRLIQQMYSAAVDNYRPL
jgi:hypothetical protein